MDKKAQRNPDWLQVILAIISAIIFVTAIPEVKAYFDKLVNAVLTAIVLTIVVAGIIWFVWRLMNRN